MIFKERPQNFTPKFEVVGCFCEHKDEILLLHRHDEKPQGNTWNIPGGKIEEGESPEDATLREVEEETGITLDKKQLMFVTRYFVIYKDYCYI